MTLRIRVIHYLLIICVGLLPLASSYAAYVDHSDFMSENCDNCDMSHTTGQGSCDGVICMSVAGLCGFGFGAMLNSAPVVKRNPEVAYMPGRDMSAARYHSHLAFSIYRPPIV